MGWGTDNPAFRRVFATLFLPEATPEQARWFDGLSRVSTDGETVARMLNMLHRIDVRSLAPQVRSPTLVTHARGGEIYSLAFFDEDQAFLDIRALARE